MGATRPRSWSQHQAEALAAAPIPTAPEDGGSARRERRPPPGGAAATRRAGHGARSRAEVRAACTP